jgi:hypothetical protein
MEFWDELQALTFITRMLRRYELSSEEGADAPAYFGHLEACRIFPAIARAKHPPFGSRAILFNTT